VPVQGHLIPKEDIETMLRENSETLFLIDEADTVTPETQAACLAARYDNAIFLGSLSKFYGLSGLRIGYLIAPLAYGRHFKDTIDIIEVSSLAILAGNIVLADRRYQQKTQTNVLASIRILQEACTDTSYRLSASPHCFGAYLYSETNNPKKELEAEDIKILEGQFFGLPASVSGGRFNLSNPDNAVRAAEKIAKIHSADMRKRYCAPA
jgi:histidinol-phosphate/aromatic aminotransferase/cobyric acid decarboxylase-like protein